ncbi:MAG TPA: histidine ammonia-lyase [Caldisericia bacterium]|nr:histidine ammonia-lyase [Caldisericia bacterium]HPB33975.1 histidine ammonia-lyase [Caldisericia bacterium]HQL67050.1 histidine ammonia-lyase [Caldisericia bacterium]HQN48144.1 histidine ammonia-lyase [Caldisericia bacterium]HQO99981.1 histidine ammonia-lyase [Caldisericia bacterium]
MAKILINGDNLTIDDIISVSRYRKGIELSPEAIDKIDESRETIEELSKKDLPIYGINTGLGKLCNIKISKDNLSKLQENIVKSHDLTLKPFLSKDAVRATLIIRANSLAKGYSGVRREIIERMILFLNEDVVPIMPQKGSLGASGDLIPLASLASFLVGEGRGIYKGKEMKSIEIHNKLGIEPLKLLEKEALSIINGTSFSLALATLSLYDAKNILKNALISSSLSMEALLALSEPFNTKIHFAKPHTSQAIIAYAINSLLEGSTLINSLKDKTQDSYVIRCIPQIYGSIYNTLKFVEKNLTIEINSSSDNPLVFSDEKIALSGGNFHGSYISTNCDFLSIELTILSNNIERRVNRLMNPTLSSGLPPFLIENSGLNTGLMLLQYLASSLVSENRTLSYPASVTSSPVSNDQEDDVSMSGTASRKLRQIVDNLFIVLSVEMISAVQALNFRKGKLGRGTQLAYNVIKDIFPGINKDENLTPYVEKIKEIVIDGSITKEVEKEIGELF